MKDKEQPQSEPVESELERRVDEMLDIDSPAEAPKPKSIAVVDATAEPRTDPVTPDTSALPSAPPVKKTRAKKSKPIAVTIHEDESAEVPAAPVLVDEGSDNVRDELADDPVRSTAPELPVDAVATPSAPADNVAKDAGISKPVYLASSEKSVDEMPTDLAEKDVTIEQAIEQAAQTNEIPTLNGDDIPLEDVLDEPSTNKAVEEIIAEEADELLAVQDSVAFEEEQVARPAFGKRLHHFLLGPKFRWAVFLVVITAGVGVGAWPSTRYAALNAAGVRAEASLLVTDQSTLQPLKNVDVRIGDSTRQTDVNGRVTFAKLKLGPSDFSVSKKAFAPITGSVTIGWGSNPLSERKLTPVGVQYAFVATDFLSGKPVGSATAAAGPADAAADDQGKIKLTLEHSDSQTTEVTVGAPGYRDEKIKLDLGSKLEIPVKLVPSKKEVFVSKRSGKYDVYKIDIDGKNETVLLAGTGSERDDIALTTHTVDDLVAVVSTRDNKRNADGYLLSTLTLINLSDDSKRTVTQSEQISIVGWTNNTLVYVQIAAGASAANPNRQRLMSYDFKQNNNRQLSSTNYFNDVLVAGEYIYFAPSSTYQAQGVQSHLFRVNPDGSSKQTILGVETWNIVRSDYSTLLFSVPNQWYDYKLGGVAARQLDQQPSSVVSRNYTDSPDKKRSLWVDQRDGKGTLLLYDVATKADKTVHAESGLKFPVRWLNDKVIIYRINTSAETADYAISLDGGEPVKIKDVTSTGGVDKWYYY